MRIGRSNDQDRIEQEADAKSEFPTTARFEPTEAGTARLAPVTQEKTTPSSEKREKCFKKMFAMLLKM